MRTREIVIAAFGAVVVLLHILGSRLLPDSWWGLHFWSFLPVWSFLLAIAVAALAVVIVLLPRPRPQEPRVAGRGEEPLIVGVLLAALYALVAWSFRFRHLLLGDGIPIVRLLPAGTAFHEREPLTYRLQHLLYSAFCSFGRPPGEETAQVAVAAGSVAAGFLFALIAWFLAGELLGNWRGDLDRSTRSPWPRVLLTAVLLCQGYALLFFGYVENYAFLLAAVAFFLLAGLRAARGAWPLFVPGIIAVVAASLHIAGALLVAAWAALLVFRVRTVGRGVWKDLGLVLAAFIAAALLLSRLSPGYNWVATILTVGRVTTTSGVKGINTTYLGSPEHLRDFFNEHWLLGPFAFFFFLLTLTWRLLSRRNSRFGGFGGSGSLFLLTNALLWLLVVVRMADSNLGYSRDWDLQAPAGLSFAVAGLYLLPPPSADREGAGLSDSHARVLLLVLVFSLVHFVPWALVNASESRAVQRIARLPLGAGRAELLVGTWHFRENRLREARDWYLKSVDAYPQNHLAYSGLGLVALRIQDYDRAERFFRLAVTINPGWAPYRESLINALVSGGRLEAAAAEYPSLLELTPRNATTWMQYGRLLEHLGRTTDARAAFQKVLEIDPGQIEARRTLEGGGAEESTGS